MHWTAAAVPPTLHFKRINAPFGGSTMPPLRRRALLGALALTPSARARSPRPTRTAPCASSSVPPPVAPATSRRGSSTEAMPGFPRGFAIENRTGAGGNIAAEAAARAAPDGYTLLLNDAAMMAINPVLFRNVPFDARPTSPPSRMSRSSPSSSCCIPSIPAAP
jgi:hypothetical protein